MRLTLLIITLASLLGGAPADAPAPDALENNWSPETAAPIAVGYVYELTFACPVAGGCPGGDHDYMRLPVKAGSEYLLATFDLGPGVDTVLELFWEDMGRPAAASDDAAPGRSFLSALRWQAPADGAAIVRVAPRGGGDQALVFAQGAGAYRFVAALAESEAARQAERRLAEQAGLPAPASAPSDDADPAPASAVSGDMGPAPAASSDPEGAAAPQPIITGGVATGRAHVVSEAPMRATPEATGELLETLPAGAAVELLGQAAGAWVFVAPVGGIRPGWVDYRNLAREAGEPPTEEEAAIPPSQPSDGPALTPAPPAQPATPLTLTRLPDELPAARPAPARVALMLDIALLTGGSEPAPIADMRVQLVDAFGGVLAEFVTPASGRIAIRRDREPGAALFVRVPAAGVEAEVDAAKPEMTIVIP